ncbi:oligogalacturonate lyase [Granulicella sp. 5B5]|uniref:oligogalacturonate lyase family protein n=1 Tax=Granulicella sp. 5B5 TaxID=1617967 RepID=UPI0015F5D5BE|nr:oligogalacturonate lyase family protein [Granulicella sp. 5B5]QMV17758.1 oligogalacturonate lyase [Granulicella sp. 5B5]
MHRHTRTLAAFAAVVLLPLALTAQREPLKPSGTGAVPPKTWVDKDTGHRVFRLTDEPGSSGFYFNINAYTPDLKTMVYSAPDGIHGMDLATKKSWLIVPNPPRPAGADENQFRFGGVHAIIAGRVTNSVFYSQADPVTHVVTLYKADVYTKKITKLTALPKGMNVATINADETLGAGTINDNRDNSRDYGQQRVAPKGVQNGPLVQPANKGEMMEQRLAARIPLTLYTINLKTGHLTPLLHSTDWVNHLLFSPKDPHLLMYCHEGPWQKVNRIWMIHTDGTHNTLIHKRRIAMEIAGHEFWGIDGETIWYDWQPIKGQDFYLAGYDLQNGKRTAYHMERNDWSIHFNLTKDLNIFTGDGGDPGQVARAKDGEWIELFHPHLVDTTGALNDPDFFQPGYFVSEHLVNMAHHNYRLEPNVRFSPDASMVIFTSNMFGPSYVFGVEVNKADNPPADEIKSTPALGEEFNPGKPTPVHAVQ